ncbi:MAG: glycosyltransferase [Alphaproteobacteria bacterium]|nr:glycosyltransferase [Alphaproteobacteria bacterium]
MPAELIRIFVGYDNRIPVAFQTLVHSITQRSSLPVAVCPINLTNIKGIFQREANSLQSTEFSFSRFLTPYLSNYEGWSIFMDNDIILQEDIAKLWALHDDRYAVMCVQHEHTPSEKRKFMGAAQTSYEKKNWSSVMLFNNAKCKALTPEFVNTASGLELHQFKWLEGDHLIGGLPLEWNYLAAYNDTHEAPVEKPALIHYTIGGPFYPEFQDTEYAREWFAEFAGANYCKEADVFTLTENARVKLLTEDVKSRKAQ